MESTLVGPAEARHATNLDQSLSELQAKIEEYEQELAELRQQGTSANPSLSASRRAPFEVMKSAFESVSQEASFMPFPSSVLPALLALRKAHQTISESRDYLSTQTRSIDKATRQLDTERNNLEDQRQLTSSLESRIQSLKEDLEGGMDTDIDPRQAARERLNEMRQKKKHYDRETARLFKDLRNFIDNRLAAQLAAEDLGGPVVGAYTDVSADDLVAGFNAQGRPKKTSASKFSGEDDGGKRQRRLEEVWGPAFAERERDDVPDEARAAGLELRDLTENLLNKLIEAGGDSSAAYVELPKETAAARFLIRSKVAQFHPKDATRMKLIDFGKEIDD